MRKLTIVALFAAMLSSCTVTTTPDLYSQVSTAEEAGLDLRCLTDEDVSVIGSGKYANRNLVISQDGANLVHLSKIDGKSVAVSRQLASPQVGTQRTFRATSTIWWGADNNLYFGDNSYNAHRPICSVSATTGTLMRQHTSGGNDYNPVLSKDKKRLLFTRNINGGNSIWYYDTTNTSLSLCCSGHSPYPIDATGKTILCVRDGAVWMIDYEKGQESLVCSSKDVRYSHPSISPNGEWILMQGTRSDASGYGYETDLYVIKVDGTELTQLTFHPAYDENPVWSKDGRRIYFISSRGNASGKYNIWSMAFPYAK